MTLKCDRVSGLICRYVDGDLRPDKAEAVREHIACCAICRAELTAEHASQRALGAQMTVCPAPDVLALVKSRTAEPPKPSRSLTFRWALAGAAAACGIVWLAATMRVPPAPAVSPDRARVEATAPRQASPEVTSDPVKSPAAPERSSGEVRVVRAQAEKRAAPRRKYAATVRPDTPKKAAQHDSVSEPEPQIEYLVVYQRHGLGDGVEVALGGDGAPAPADSSYTIQMTDESTGSVTGVSSYSSASGESRESATVEYKSETQAPEGEDPERSSTDEKPLDSAGGIADNRVC